MGELAEDFRFMKEQAKKHREKIEPSRVEYAVNELMRIGCRVAYNASEKCVNFWLKDIKGKIYPFKGWYSVKGIGDGRGIKNLIKRLKRANNNG